MNTQMNRKQKRNLEKNVRKKLTDEQYKEYKQQAMDMAIKEEVDRQLELIWTKINIALNQAFEENKISKKKVATIYDRMFQIIREENSDIVEVIG